MTDADHSADTAQNEPVAPAGDTPICSARGCRAPAVWELHWNNPQLHDPDRRKVWLACDAHRGSLADFLAARSFLRDVVPLTVGS